MAFRHPHALMLALAVDPATITGAARAAASRHRLPTMRTLSDPFEYFAAACRTELEHGTAGAPVGTDVTGDIPLDTARIVVAHLLGVEHGVDPSGWTPFPAYYDYLWHMEQVGPRRRPGGHVTASPFDP